MAWETEIPDVVAGQPIEAAWGNKIRNQVVHIVATVAALPVVPDGGFAYVEADDALYVRRSGVWVPPSPLGLLGYAQVTAQQAGMGATIADLTGLSVTVTVLANRRIRVEGKCAYTSSDGVFGNHIFRLAIREGSTALQENHTPLTPSSNVFSNTATVIVTPSAGAHTYKLSALQTNNAVACSMHASPTMPAFIAVQDIGAA